MAHPHITRKSSRGLKRNMPARRVVAPHRTTSVGTHPAAPPNAFSNPGSKAGTTAALLYQSGSFGPGK